MTEIVGTKTSVNDPDSSHNLGEERPANTEDEVTSDQVPTLALHDKLFIRNSSRRLFVDTKMDIASPPEHDEAPSAGDWDEVLTNGDVASPDSRRKNVVAGKKHEGKGSSKHVENNIFDFEVISQDNSSQKV